MSLWEAFRVLGFETDSNPQALNPKPYTLIPETLQPEILNSEP